MFGQEPEASAEAEDEVDLEERLERLRNSNNNNNTFEMASMPPTVAEEVYIFDLRQNLRHT